MRLAASVTFAALVVMTSPLAALGQTGDSTATSSRRTANVLDPQASTASSEAANEGAVWVSDARPRPVSQRPLPMMNMGMGTPPPGANPYYMASHVPPGMLPPGMPPGGAMPPGMGPGMGPQGPYPGMTPASYGGAPGMTPGPQGGYPSIYDEAMACDDGGRGFGDPPRQKYYTSWAKFEYLYWSPRGMRVPPMVTSSPAGTPQAIAGELGQASTQVLFGDDRVNDEYRPGGRLTAGVWFGTDELLGVEAQFMAMENNTTRFEANSNFSGGTPTGPILARPFFNADINMQDAILLAFPNFDVLGVGSDLDGAVTVETHSEIESGGILRREVLWLDVFDRRGMSYLKIYWVGGYRYFRLDEQISVNDSLTPVGGAFAPGSRIVTHDQFDADNEFHGGDFGLTAELARGPWAIELVAKAAIGNNHEVVDVQGSTTSTDGISTFVFDGGLLTQPTNIQKRSQDMLAVIPEIGLNLTCQVNKHVKLTAGYNFIYFSNVVRPSDQIDLALNPTQFDGGVLIGPPRPGAILRDSEYWLHGGNAGVEIKW